MSGPRSSESITFDVIHNDGLIRVRICEGVATFTVEMLREAGVIVRAFRKAIDAGAARGVMFTGELVNEKLAAVRVRRTQAGITWLGGRVTRLNDGRDGPQFQIEWDTLPRISE